MRSRNCWNAALSAALVALVAALPTGGARAQESRNTWTWSHSDDNKKLEVKVENKVEFNEDYSDVSDIPSDGALRIVDTRDSSMARRLVVTRGASGELQRDYALNGARREFDAAAREWLRATLLVAARRGGLDARNRVRRILARGGSKAVIQELTHIEGDYARRIYFDEFLKIDNLGDEERHSALVNASQSIKSDYERAQLLLGTAGVYLPKGSLAPAYFEALGRLSSDYERRRVLSVAIKRTDLSREALSAMAPTAAAIGSDYEKATFLSEAARRHQADDRLRAAFFAATNSIGSDYERRRVLNAALKSGELSRDALIDVARSAARMKSDYEKATFLIGAADRYQADERLRAVFLEAVGTIGSDYERSRVQTRFARLTN
ncbi:MAG: hypothetical protein LC785_09020 [Acidobacteria bacterium]|nr:hypothetical protein [Acidobacteriota bacterium]MCA1642076.1 hypothetical protein [Acidobacteriota bacterium]